MSDMTVLKRLREQHKATVDRTTEYMKEHRQFRSRLTKCLKEGPMTVPELAQAMEAPAHRVLWHITGMKKYDMVDEVEQAGEYFKYALREGK